MVNTPVECSRCTNIVPNSWTPTESFVRPLFSLSLPSVLFMRNICFMHGAWLHVKRWYKVDSSLNVSLTVVNNIFSVLIPTLVVLHIDCCGQFSAVMFEQEVNGSNNLIVRYRGTRSCGILIKGGHERSSCAFMAAAQPQKEKDGNNSPPC